MNWMLIKNWLFSLTWIQILPIAISILAVIISIYQSKKALKMSAKSLQESRRANEIADQALSESSKQFKSLYRPLLVVKQMKFGDKQKYLEMSIENGKITVTTLISIENAGSIIAGNMFVHSSTGVLRIGNREIGRDEQKYKPLNPNDNLSSLHIPPQQTILRQMGYQFQIPSDIDRNALNEDKALLIQNILIHYYSDTIQTPMDKVADKQYHTNVTHLIQPHWYTTNIQMF